MLSLRAKMKLMSTCVDEIPKNTYDDGEYNAQK